MSSTVCYKCNRTGHFARECSQGGGSGGGGGGFGGPRGGRGGGGPRGGSGGGGGFGRGECEFDRSFDEYHEQAERGTRREHFFFLPKCFGRRSIIQRESEANRDARCFSKSIFDRYLVFR